MLSRALLPLLLLAIPACAARADLSIVSPGGADPLERLAAREVRRYYYLRTGELLPIVSADRAPGQGAIVVARMGRGLAGGLGPTGASAGSYAIRGDGRRTFIVGADDLGTLYGAYQFARELGVRFYIHGDVVPDERLRPGTLPVVTLDRAPLFDTRGIQPFHDFPEGPDWWNRDDYLAYIAQLPKMGMNFIGLHTYPECEVGPEAAVWIGLPSDIGREARVNSSYPSWWATTARDGPWAFRAMKTSGFSGGAGLFFETEDYGPDVMAGFMPRPVAQADCNEVFRRSGLLLKEAFAEARFLGVKTCIGTETPLTIPTALKARLAKRGLDPKDPKVVRMLYEGMFRRIAAVCPVDTYWLWTPESWTWEADKPGEFQRVSGDIAAALDGLKAAGSPFKLATCGWVLGPRQDRAALDRILPKDCAMSCINRKVGHAPDEPGFANISGRPKWVIPWLENDPSLAAPEPWAGRMRYDAYEARRLGCTGLIGIHWRTEAIAPNITALADAAWDQGWVPPGTDTTRIPPGGPMTDPASDGEGLNHPRIARSMPVGGFYEDLAGASFGGSVAREAGALLTAEDGVKLPQPCTWINGPGNIKVETRPWAEVARDYAFVAKLEALRPRVTGAGNLSRFDYLLNTYRGMRAMAETACARGELDRMMAAVAARKEPAAARATAEQALRLRLRMARLWEEMMRAEVAATDTPGEMGTLTNLEQHNRLFMHFLDAHDGELAKALGRPLPISVEPSRDYAGPARITVTAVRTLALAGEPLRLRIVVLDSRPPEKVTVYSRPMGQGAYLATAAEFRGGGVFAAALPALSGDTEYYVLARTASGRSLAWPATAPRIAQTIVVR
jgi:hypothetical protein